MNDSPMALLKPFLAHIAHGRDVPPSTPSAPRLNPPTISIPQTLPRSLHSLERLSPSTPLAPLPYQPSPHISPGTPYAAPSVAKLPISRRFWCLRVLIWVKDGSK